MVGRTHQRLAALLSRLGRALVILLVHVRGPGLSKLHTFGLTAVLKQSLLTRPQNHHAIPYENQTYQHHNHPLVLTAEVNLETMAANQRDLLGHHHRHSALYHLEIARRLEIGYELLDSPGIRSHDRTTRQRRALAILEAVIESIWEDIGNGTLRPYSSREVYFVP